MTMSDEKIGSLEEEARKRKERLNALKRKKTTDDDRDKNTDISETLPKPKFRSYRPEDASLKETILPEAKPGDVENEVKDLLNASTSRVVIDELDIQNLAPRKPDWDLKRDVAKKLEVLDKRTQRAIAELIRERLKSRHGDDLAAIVNTVGNIGPNEDREA